MVDLLQALSNPETVAFGERLTSLSKQARSAPVRRTKVHAKQARHGLIERAVVHVLHVAEGALDVRAIHAAVEREIGETVSYGTVKAGLARMAKNRRSVVRVGFGRYRASA